MKKRAILYLALLMCLAVFVGSAPAYYRSVTPTWEAATVLYGEAVCPTLLPGSEDGSVIIRWVSWTAKPVTLHYGEDDGSGVLGEGHSVLPVSCERSGALGLFVYSAELYLTPGEWLYSLTEEGETEPGVLYPIHWRTGEAFRVVMSSDSHVSNGAQTAPYEEAIAAALGTEGADLIIHGGDLNDNTEASPYVLSHNAPHTRSVPTLALCGNHDLAVMIYGYFTPPHLEARTGDYWTVQGNVLFVGLNVNLRDMPAHQRYLREAVTDHREGCDWVVLLIHYSMMSNGAHAMDGPVIQFRDALRELIAELDVDLVISGHDHEYDRSYLIGAEDMVEGSGGETVEKEPGQALYLSLPTASGVKHYSRSRESLYPLAVEGLLHERGYVTAEFTPECVRFQARSADTDETVDRFVLRRGEG